MQTAIRQITMPAAALVALAAACATPPVTNATANTTPVVLVDEHGHVYRTSDGPTAASFSTPPDSTFKALVASYSAIGIEPTSVDPQERVVTRQAMVFRTRFQGRPLSAAFDCGNGQFGPRADDGRIRANITSQVVGTGTGSSVTTTIEATLAVNDGAARDPIRCASHGGIEEALRREVSSRLGIPYERL